MKNTDRTKCDMIECSAFDNIHQAVMVIDKDFNVIALNKAASSQRNCKTEKFRKCYLLSHNSDIPCWEEGLSCPVKEAFDTKEHAMTVHKHFYGDKEVFEEINATPVSDENGEVMYVIEELRDISKLLKLENVINSLRREVKELQGIIPICSGCKKVRDDEGFWSNVENYVSTRSEAKFSHSLCPDCLKDLYPEVAERLDKKNGDKKTSKT